MTDGAQQIAHEADRSPDEAATARLAVRFAIAGFGLMFVAALAMWAKFGPTMFVDLATAVISCF